MTESSILTLKNLLEILHTSRATFYRTILKDPTFPRSFKLGKHTVSWLRADVEAWILAKAAAAKTEVAA